MVVEIISISLIIIITYVYLVFLLLKREPFKKMIILSMSIFLFFIIIFKSLTNIMGYPAMHQLPSKFNLLYVKVIDENIFILVDEIGSESYPRLHILDHSISLEDQLKSASNDIQLGRQSIGIIDKKISDNAYGIVFKEIKRNIPNK
ncbi:MAG: hypothetical protein ACJ0QZ_01350 [Gammaproteobacteria bacterium]|tara:strand:- start:740 stop:1180 length:441 start_codon:yes stop_codon:yes gene_type:complete